MSGQSCSGAPRQSRSQQTRNQHESHRRTSARMVRPSVAYHQRSGGNANTEFSAPEIWYDATGRTRTSYRVQPPGTDYRHAVTVEEVRERLKQLPEEFTQQVEVIQFSTMTRKRRLFPCYGMQWGANVYLYPIELSLKEVYIRSPRPEQMIEARMFGGVWTQCAAEWHLTWTEQSIKDFYLNNVLIHEVGHVVDHRNTRMIDRERYANWFAIEYGYRPTRGRSRLAD